MTADLLIAGDHAGAGDGLDFPELSAIAVVFLASWEGMHEGSLGAVGSQSGIGGEGYAVFGGAGEQFHDLGGEFVDAVEVGGAGIGDEGDVEVGAVGEFGAAEFAQAQDGEGRFTTSMLAEDGLERVLKAGVSQVGEFVEVELEIDEAEDVAQSEAHEFGLVIAPDPGQLILVFGAVAELVEDLSGGFTPEQLAAEHEILDQIGRADGGFGEKLGAVEQEEQQFEKGRVAGPGFVEHGARTVSSQVTVEADEDAVGVGERLGRPVGLAVGLVPGTMPEEFADEAPGEFGGAGGHMDVTGSFDEGAEDVETAVDILERMLG